MAPDTPSRGAAEQAAAANAPVAPPLDDQRLREIVRIVRATLEAEKPREEGKPEAPFWKRASAFCLEHWALTAFAASVLVLIGAAVGYQASPFYWFKQIAVADAELDRQQAKFDFDQKMADRQIQLGESFLDVWRLKDAAKAFDDALALDPASVPASFGRFKANMFADAASGAYDAEVTQRRLQRILDIDPKDPYALAALGEYFYFQEDWGKARDYYRRALAERRFAHALFGLGMVELKNEDYAAAAAPLAEAAKLSPFNWRYLANLAFVQAQTGEVQPAIATYETLSRLDPEALLPYVERVRLHLQQGEVGKVRTILEHVADLIEDEGIAKGANNNGEWFFPAGEETVYLSNLSAKRAYVHSSRAAILYVVGEEESAEHAAHRMPKLSDGDAIGVIHLIRYDLTLLGQRRGDLKVRAQGFTGWWEPRLARGQ